MREFDVSIYERLAKGLTPDYRTTRNSGLLLECINAKANKYGLVPYEPVIIPFTQDTLSAYSIELRWPHPQLLKGSKYTFLADRRSIYLVNEEDYSLYGLELYDSTTGNLGSIHVGNQWQLADFWDTWMLHNGQCSVFHTGRHKMLGTTDKIYFSEHIRVQAGCASHGRNWMGGFDKDNFYTQGFRDTFIEAWASLTVSNIDKLNVEGLNENWVAWSSIGGGDMFLLFFLVDDAESGLVTPTGYSTSDPFWFQLMKRNEWGFMPMSWQGKVLMMKPLGDMIIVYGEGGVSALKSSGKFVSEIKLEQLSNGINNTGAVGGDDNEHLLVDKGGYLWRINRDLSIEKLGYQNQLSDLISGEIIVSFDSKERDFYICNGYRGFIYNKQGGLTEHTQQVTSIINSNGYTLSMGTDESYMDKTFRLKTDSFDLGLPGNKTLTFVDVACELPFPTVAGGNTKMFVSVEYRMHKREDWRMSREITLNNDGRARIGVTANMFRVILRGEDFRDMNIDNITVRFQKSDKRYTRGIRISDVS